MRRAQIGKTTSRKTQDSKILVVEKGNSNNSDGDSDWEEKCGVSRDFCCPHTNHCEYFCRRLPYVPMYILGVGSYVDVLCGCKRDCMHRRRRDQEALN